MTVSTKATHAILFGAVVAGATAALVAYLRGGGSSSSPRQQIAVLTDNGSYRGASYLSLARMAAGVAARLGDAGISVISASARFAERIPASELPAGMSKPLSLEPTLRKLASEGYKDFLLLPAFIGPSSTYTEYGPEVFAKVAAEYPGITLTTTRAPVDVDGEPGDQTVARIVVENVRATAAAQGLQHYAVAVCDHGSPNADLGRVRTHVAQQVRALLENDVAVSAVTACSMERRPEPAFDFNEPLLEKLLRTGPPEFTSGPVVVALLFISPGKHAGEGGDIATIIADAQRDAAARGQPGLVAHMTPLLGESEAWVDLLARRAREGLRDMPSS